MEQSVTISGTMIIGTLITIFGTIGTSLVFIIWWNFTRSLDKYDKEREAEKVRISAYREEDRQGRILMYTQMENDRAALAKKVDMDKGNFEEKVARTAELFGAQIKTVGIEFMAEIKEIKNQITAMSTTLSNLSSNFLSSEKRIDRQQEEIEMLRSRTHGSDNNITELRLKLALYEKEREQIMAKNNLTR